MNVNFLDHISLVEDPRIPGMVTYPLDEVLLTTLVGLLCRAEDFDEIESVGTEQLEWLRRFLPFEHGIPQAQSFRKVFRVLDPAHLEAAFSSWVDSLHIHVVGGVVIEGKALRGSRPKIDGRDALHLDLLSAYAHEAGLLIGQCTVADGGNETTAIPELLDALELSGAIAPSTPSEPGSTSPLGPSTGRPIISSLSMPQ